MNLSYFSDVYKLLTVYSTLKLAIHTEFDTAIRINLSRSKYNI